MTLQEAERQAVREYLLGVLEKHNWNYVHTAREAGINRSSLYVALDRLGIRRPEVNHEAA